MIHSCPKCQSFKLHKRGSYFNKTEQKYMQRLNCISCDSPFSIELNDEFQDEYRSKNISNHIEEPEFIDLEKEQKESIVNSYNNTRYVITSCQNDTLINKEFYNSLLGYCKHNDAKLLVLRTKYKVEEDGEGSYLVNPEYLLKNNIIIADKIKVFGGLQLSPTLVSPLSGLDSLSAGYTCIFGASSYQMRSLPINSDMHPIIMSTTGCISVPNNSDTKTGYKADYFHSYSAVVIEVDSEDDIFHIRVITADDFGGFYDLTKYYKKDEVSDGHRIEGIVLGDIHIDVADPEVIKATYTNKDSIINTLMPHDIILNDLLDFNQLSSHHNRQNYLKRFSMYIEGNDDVEAELKRTVDFLINLTPKFANNRVVSSNHTDHLEHFLNGTDIKTDYKNSILYHFLMHKLLVAIKEKREVNAFQLYFEEYCKDEDLKNRTTFLGREDSYFIKDIMVSQHGDKAPGSGKPFSAAISRKIPFKMIVGHCHSPYADGLLWAAGTLTAKLSYARGTMSGWLNSSVIIYHSGARSHINIINGKWKL